MAPFNRSHTSSYSSFIVTMAVSYTVFEIKRDVGPKTPILHTPFYLTCTISYSHLELMSQILIQTVQVPELLGGAKILQKSSTI